MRKNSYYVLPGFLLIGILIVVSGCATSDYQKNMKSPPIDRISEAELARLAPKPVAALTLDDIVRLGKEGNSPDQIIEKIKASNSIYELTPSQSIALNQQGVDNKVLDYIHTSRELAWRNSIADEINKREKAQRAEIEKLKLLLEQRHYYNPYCGGYYGLHPYGYGFYGSHFGIGAGPDWPWGCW